MKKSVYVVGGVLVVCVIGIALFFGFSRSSGMMRAYANRSNIATAGSNDAVASLDEMPKATLNGGIQTVTTTLDNGQYSPIVVQKDVPFKWTITARNGDINSCNNEMIIKDYNIDEKLKAGENVIEFTPTESGTFTYSCWMGMITSTITVVDDINNITDQDNSGYSGNSGSGRGWSSCENGSGI